MDYRQNLKNHKRIIVKIGSTSLAYENGRINLKRIEKIAWVLSDLINQGKEIILVSSGAVAVGGERLGLSERPHDLLGKQVSSAVGQAALIQIYQNMFLQYNQTVAQILLTKDVFDSPSRRRNAKNTMIRLIEMGVVPIINENDAISTDELSGFSDNDTLSAFVCDLLDCDLLIILSDIKGLYTSDPNLNNEAQLISTITKIDDDIINLAGGSTSEFGSGGMITKVNAAIYANKSGADLVIASGEDPSILFNILEGECIGTLFASNTVLQNE